MSKVAVSSTGFGFLPTPTAATDEVRTTRSTSASSADSRTMRVPRTFVSQTASRSSLRSDVAPGDVEDSFDVRHRAPDGPAVGYVADRPLELEV